VIKIRSKLFSRVRRSILTYQWLRIAGGGVWGVAIVIAGNGPPEDKLYAI
jgi:hypothetical protein